MELCQREVHLFLRDYFTQFTASNLKIWCATYKVRDFVIPKDYLSLASRYEIAKLVGQQSLQSPNLALIPHDKGRIQIVEKPSKPGEIWGCRVMYYADDQVPVFPDKEVETFDAMKEQVRCIIGVALSSCPMMLAQLQTIFPELKNLSLELDKEKMVWNLKDKILNKPFAGKLGVSFKILSDEEIDQAQSQLDAFRRVK
jgi:hypothetical protein